MQFSCQLLKLPKALLSLHFYSSPAFHHMYKLHLMLQKRIIFCENYLYFNEIIIIYCRYVLNMLFYTPFLFQLNRYLVCHSLNS